MTLQPVPPLLNATLIAVARRYRVPAMPAATPTIHPAAALGMVIEEARQAVALGAPPDAALKHQFIDALARMIHEAMAPERGDPAFQALVLRKRSAQVQEYASLAAHADQDRRDIQASANNLAHPAKLLRMPAGPLRDALAQLQEAASSASWPALSEIATRILDMPDISNTARVQQGLTRLIQGAALARLQRLDALSADEQVKTYKTLWDRFSHRPGSPEALSVGIAAQQRGAAVEALTSQALEALARRLDDNEQTPGRYRVVTSMRVPASIPGSADHAKSEWDAVLLRLAQNENAEPVWDVCLLAEAKASVDAATTDLPRLLRGLHLLAHAEENAVYSFQSKQGLVPLRGASLRALTTDEPALARTVLYCCNAPADAWPRLLTTSSRMQLLSAPASVEFGCAVAEQRSADSLQLLPVWAALLESPKWASVLNQYPMLRQVRELMVHTDDLLAAVALNPIADMAPPKAWGV